MESNQLPLWERLGMPPNSSKTTKQQRRMVSKQSSWARRGCLHWLMISVWIYNRYHKTRRVNYRTITLSGPEGVYRAQCLMYGLYRAFKRLICIISAMGHSETIYMALIINKLYSICGLQFCTPMVRKPRWSYTASAWLLWFHESQPKVQKSVNVFDILFPKLVFSELCKQWCFEFFGIIILSKWILSCRATKQFLNLSKV